MKLCIVDDNLDDYDLIYLNVMKVIKSENLEIKIIGKYIDLNNINSAFEFIQNNKPDIIFLDYYLSYTTNGVELLLKIKDCISDYFPFVIFTSKMLETIIETDSFKKLDSFFNIIRLNKYHLNDDIYYHDTINKLTENLYNAYNIAGQKKINKELIVEIMKRNDTTKIKINLHKLILIITGDNFGDQNNIFFFYLDDNNLEVFVETTQFIDLTAVQNFLNSQGADFIKQVNRSIFLNIRNPNNTLEFRTHRRDKKINQFKYNNFSFKKLKKSQYTSFTQNFFGFE